MLSARRKFIYRSIAIYLAVFVCLMLLLIPGYLLFRTTLEQNAIATNQAVLTEGVKRLEGNLRTMQGASRTLIQSNKILQLSPLGEELTPADAYMVKEAQETFNNITSQFALLSECGLYLKNGALLFNNQFYRDTRFFYPYFFSANDQPDFESWLHSLQAKKLPFSLSHQTVTASGHSYDALVYAEPLPFQTNWKSSVFFAVLKVEDIASLMVLPDTLKNARLAFADGSGAELFAYSFLNESDKQIRITVDIPSLGLTATLDLRYEYIIASMTTYGRYILLFFSVYLLCGIVLFAVLIRRNLRPILGWMDNAEHILQEIHSDTPVHNIHASQSMNEFLQFVRTRLQENRTLLQEQQETLRTNLFELALRNDMPSKSDAIMHGLFDDFPKQWRMVVIRILDFTKRSQEDCSAIHLYAKSVLTSFAEAKWRHFSGDMMVVIVPASCSQAYTEQMIGRIREAFLFEAQVEIQSAVSQLREGEQSLAETFALLRTRLRALESEVPAASFVEDGNSMNFSLVCAATDANLYETIMRGDSEAVRKNIYSLADRYCHLKQINETDLMQYFFLCRSALLQAGNDLNLTDFPYPVYSTKADIQSMCTALCQCAASLCEYALKRMHDNADSFDEKLLNWIGENLGNSMLCIQSTVEQFSLSPSTLQRVIRRRTGLSFQEYVEASRMNLACELLTNTALSTKDVAEQCGFSSPNSFYKAFRRRFQMSPTDMRNQRA